jgi:hypothetical protein
MGISGQLELREKRTMALPNSTNLRRKINTKINSGKIDNKINGEGKNPWDAKPVTLKWHQFHLWIASKDFLFLELAKEQEESIARILRRLIREYRIQMEDSRH